MSLVPSIPMQYSNHDFFFCVDVMYSGEYDFCDVTLSVYPDRASLKIWLAIVGIDANERGYKCF
jgi:hypothetical protein